VHSEVQRLGQTTPALNILSMDKWEAVLNRCEPWVFFSLLSAQLTGIWMLPVFLTLDGPGHVYNLNVMRDLTMNEHSVFQSWFEVSSQPLPNLIGYFLARPVLSLFSPTQVEQWLVSWSVVSLALGFRFFFQKMDRKQGWGSWLIFFFTFNGPLLSGFFNFSIGLGIAFLALGQFIVTLDSPCRKNHIVLAVMLIVLYFSHFAALGFFGLAAIGFGFSWLIAHRKMKGSTSRYFAWRIGALCIAMLPAASLSMWYVMVDKEPTKTFYLSFSEVLYYFTLDMGLKTYSPREWIYLRWLWILLAAGLALQLLYSHFSKVNTPKLSPHFRGWWYAFSVISIMAFVLPNGTSGGGFLIFRMVLMALILLFAGCLLYISQPLLRLIVLILLTYVGFDHLGSTLDFERRMQERIAAIRRCGDVMRPYSVLATVDFAQIWPYNHAPALIGCDRKQVMTLVLNGQRFFSPLRFKGEMFREQVVEDIESKPTEVDPVYFESRLTMLPDYWLSVGYPDAHIADTLQRARWNRFFERSCSVLYADSINGLFVYQRKQ